MRTMLITLTVACYCITESSAQTASGGIQGRVVDQNGAAVPGAVVVYSRGVSYLPRQPGSHLTPVLAPGEVSLSGYALADSNGAYAAGGLPAGNYGMCVYHQTLPYLDPCKWARGTGASVLQSVQDAGATVLQKGVFLRVQVNDPDRLLASSTTLLRSDLTIGVMTVPGAFWPASLVAASAAGRTYLVPVPPGQALYCWIWSGDYTLSDSKGSPIAAGGSKLPFQAEAGVDQVFTLSVTGTSKLR
jgi:hypothetical protein